jgi:hypothetical protein
MVRKLTKLRIDEISSVDRGANEGAKIVLMKRDSSDDNPPYLFNDIIKAKEPRSNTDEQRTNTIPDDDKVSSKLTAMVDAMIVAVPSLDRQTATHFLLHSARGRRLAEHFNNISKGEQPMNRQQEMQQMHKFIKEGGMPAVAKRVIEKGSTSLTEVEYTECIQEEATRKGISFEKAFADPMTQQAYQIVREAGYVKSLVANVPGSYDAIIKGMATLKPTSTEVGNTLVADDSAEAVRLLNEMAEKQGRKFEDVLADPKNSKLAARTYTRAHRSSINTDYLDG